jgi:hypothetical protein
VRVCVRLHRAFPIQRCTRIPYTAVYAHSLYSGVRAFPIQRCTRIPYTAVYAHSLYSGVRVIGLLCMLIGRCGSVFFCVVIRVYVHPQINCFVQGRRNLGWVKA